MKFPFLNREGKGPSVGEYLIILVIVIVIALILLGMLGKFGGA